MKVKQNKYKIDLQPYPAQVLLILTDDVPEATRKYNQEKETDSTDLAVFVYEVPDNGNYCLIINYKATPGSIAHEVNHLTTMFLHRLGVDIIKNDEPNCYYIGFLVDKIWDNLRKIELKALKQKERLVGKDDSNKNQ